MPRFKRNKFLLSERGNIFFAIFGAIALVGIVGTAVVTTMRGPLSTMVEVQNRTQAESEMAIASRLALLEATELAADGDCDSDGFVEPLEWTDAAGNGPTGGGFLPAEISSSRLDPWGIEYGYCAWDAGNVIDAIACDTNSDSNYYRLDGNGDANDETYTIIAVISAGPDQTFQTTCTGGASPDIVSGGDDIVTEYTYQGAVTATNGLWNIKSGDPTTAQISKNLEVSGGATFTDGIDLTGSASALQLGAASMLFPNETTLPTCNGANDGLIRINTTTTPDTLEVCDNAFGGWVSVGGAGIWTNGAGDDIYYNAGTPQVGIGTTTPDDTLDIVGTLDTSGAVTFGSTLDVTGAATLGSTLDVTGDTALADTSVADLNATGAVDFDSTLNVDGLTTVANVQASGSYLSGTGNISTVSGTVSGNTIAGNTGQFTNLEVSGTSDLQGTVSDSTGDLTLGDNVVITGTTDAQGSISSSGGNVTISDSLDVTGSADVTGAITAGSGDIGGTLEANDYTYNGNDFTPATCSSGSFNRWSGTQWVCESDTSGSGTGGINAGVFEVDETPDPDVVRMKSAVGTGYADVDFVFGSPQLADDGTNDSRMFFDKSKAAFRAGSVTGTQWDDASVGQNSVVLGSGIASGANSSVLGVGTASGDHSTVLGAGVATGNLALSSGFFTTASGTGAFSRGNFSIASGEYSFASGGGTTASGYLSYAQGSSVLAGSGTAADGAGDYSRAYGMQSAAQATRPMITGDRSAVFFFDGGVVDANSTYDFTESDKFALIGGEFQIGETQAQGANKGCLRFNAATDLLEYSDDCSTYVAFSGGGIGNGLWENNSGTIRVKPTATTGGNFASDDFVFGSPQLADAGDSDHDNRMFFDKSKGAFRAGTANNTEWDDVNVGNNSFSAGVNNIALGASSFVAGGANLVAGTGSTAFGGGNNVYGDVATAFGLTVGVGDVLDPGDGAPYGDKPGDLSMAIGLGQAAGAAPLVTANSSLGIFMGDQSGYDLSTDNRMALVGGDILIDDDGTAGSEGCIRYVEGSGLEFSDDCTTFNTFSSLGGDGDRIIDADGDTQIQVEEGADDDTIRFDTAGTERAVILPTGEVGIGTASPNTNLEILTANNATDTVLRLVSGVDSGSTARSEIQLLEGNSGAYNRGVNIYYDGSAGDHLGLEVINSGGATEALRIVRTSGNMGLGDFSSDAVESKLHIQSGDIRLDGGAGNAAGCLRFNDTSDQLEYSDDCSTYATFASLGAGLWTDNTENITRENFHILDAGETMTSAGFDGGIGGDAFVWHSDKGALRAGANTNVRWDEANIGDNSIALGNNSEASGDQSLALGSNTEATGYRSVALGWGVDSTAQYSLAFGSYADATGNYSASLGLGVPTTTAPAVSGTNSFGIFMGDQDGINLATANTMAILGGDFIVGSYQLDDTADAGGAQDSRMFFDVSKGAFRAGGVDAAQWDDASVGTRSFAAGTNTTASGINSFALGVSTIASGNNSFAGGNAAQASAVESFAFGRSATASDVYAIAMGYRVTASGPRSIALGSEATASGDYSMGIGLGIPAGADPIVSGTSSLGIFMGDQSGYDLTTANRMALVGGDFLIDDDGTAGSQGCIRYTEGTGLEFSDDCTTFNTISSIAGGSGLWTDNTTHITRENFNILDAGETFTSASFDGVAKTGFYYHTDKYALRLGSNSATRWDESNIGISSVAFGNNRVASGVTSMAWGFQSIGASGATGSSSTSFGSNTLASGQTSTAFGSTTVASADSSTAWGSGTTASGINSTAYGYQAEAGGGSSVAIGLQTAAQTTDPVVSGDRSMALFFDGGVADANSAYDLTATDTFALVGGELMIDSESSSAASRGCIRFNDTTDVLEYSDDCSTYTAFSAAADSDWTDDSANSRVYNTTDSIGIGTSIPLQEFDVSDLQLDVGTGLCPAGYTEGDFDGDADAADCRQLGAMVDTATGDFIVGSYQLDDVDGDAEDNNRLFFDKSKGAFRAGGGLYDGHDPWNDGNVGDYSIALGQNTLASGNSSMSWGRRMSSSEGASGNYSTAFGFRATASGEGATSFGNLTVASGVYSTAFGRFVSAGSGTSGDGTGDYSVAIGLQSASQATRPVVTGDRSMALFFDGGVADANSAYDLTADDTFALVGGNMFIDNPADVGNITINRDGASGDALVFSNFGSNRGHAINWNNQSYISGSSSWSQSDSNIILWTGDTGPVSDATSLNLDASTAGYDTLDDAAFTFNYTVNKPTSGDDTGLLITRNETAAAGTSLIIDAQNGGVTQFSLDPSGNSYFNGTMTLDGGVGNESGCIRFNDTSDQLEFSHDCSTYSTMGSVAAGALDIDDLGDAYTDYVTDNNLFLGQGAGASIAAGGESNIFIGEAVGGANTIGDRNIAIGLDALSTNVAKHGNIAIGTAALRYANDDGTAANGHNIAIGHNALRGSTTAANNTGTENTAIGAYTLTENTSGAFNTALGYSALNSNAALSYNTAIGAYALRYANNTATNTVAEYGNTAIGYRAMEGSSTPANNTGGQNTAIGLSALASKTSGNLNVALGSASAANLTSGNNNVTLGALSGGDITSGSSNIMIGYDAEPVDGTADNQLNIGNLIYGDLANEDFIVGSWQLDDTGNGTEDNRMYFDKSKGAFRAGSTNNDDWDVVNTGDYSAAFGYNATSSGNSSFAAGQAVNATSGQSVAFGYQTTASGQRSFAMGENVTVSGSRSVGFGLSNASGVNPTVSAGGSFAIFMGDQSGYDLSTVNRMALVGGDFLIDDDGTAGSQGCIRYLEGTGLQFSHDCSTWTLMGGASAGAINIDDLGDGYTDYATDYNLIMGRTSAAALTSGAQYNLFLGQDAGATSGNSTATTDSNTAVGYTALAALTSGNSNTAIGSYAMTNTTTGERNTAVGNGALWANTTGNFNTALGRRALRSNTTGLLNVAVGDGASTNNTTSQANVAVGVNTLSSNVARSGNTAVGHGAMQYADDTSTSANSYNTALGFLALTGSTTAANNTGTLNTALGASALTDNTSGSNNVAIGYQAGDSITTGSDNILIGYDVDASAATASNELNIGGLITGDLTAGAGLLAINGTGALTLPVGTNAQRPTGAAGMIRYNTDASGDIIEYYDAENTTWTTLASGASAVSEIDDLSDAATDYATDFNMFMGNSAGAAIASGGQYNLALGQNALSNVTTGDSNLGIGMSSVSAVTTGSNNVGIGASTLQATTGSSNLAISPSALISNTTGGDNIGIGFQSLYGNTVGNYNVGIGVNALNSNVAKSNSTAIGYGAMQYADDTTTPGTGDNVALGYLALQGSTTASNNIGSFNTAIGSQSLMNASSAGQNTAIGGLSMTSTTTGGASVAVGYQSLQDNTTGSYNVGVGRRALQNNVDGQYNVALGSYALLSNVANQNNTAIGHGAMQNANDTGTGAATNNTALGYLALMGSGTASNNTGTGNVALGASALTANTAGSGNMAMGVNALGANTTGGYNIAIGNFALALNTDGYNNIALGDSTMASFNTTNFNNVVVGMGAFNTATAGSRNTIIGHNAMASSTGSSENVAIGENALLSATGGSNTALGYQAGDNVTTGNRNILIGSSVDAPSATGDDQLNIGGLITGDLTAGAGLLAINGTGALTLPVGTNAQRPTGAAGMIRYNTDASGDIIEYYDAENTTWTTLASGASAVSEIDDLSDAWTDYTTYHNMALGDSAGTSAGTNAQYNIALGANALNSQADSATCDGASWYCDGNIAIGYNALTAETIGAGNVAIGRSALATSAGGHNNVGIGTLAGTSITAGTSNIAIGSDSLTSSTIGNAQIAIGYRALRYANTGYVDARNIGIGYATLHGVSGSSTGGNNIAMGYGSGFAYTTGSNNLLLGSQSGNILTTGSNNVALGYQTGGSITTGSGNIVIGAAADVVDGTADSHLNIGNLIYGDLANEDFIVGSWQLDDTGTGNEDARMFFDKSKGAFRAGNVNGTQWDDANVGTNTAAFGLDNTASGVYSAAFGQNNTVTGTHSISFGRNNTVSGGAAMATGFQNTASGNGSTVMGRINVASGLVSTAMGEEVQATGSHTIGMGLNTADQAVDPIVSGARSIGIFMDGGVADATSGVDISDTDTMALIGGKFLIDDDGTAGSQGCIRYLEGTGLQFSHDCTTYTTMAGAGGGLWTDNTTHITRGNVHLLNGGETMASAGLDGGLTNSLVWVQDQAALRMGTSSVTSWDDAEIGANSIAIGSSIASGGNSFAMGNGSEASGSYSFAFGNGNNDASGSYSIAMGFGADATATNAIALGRQVTTSGQYSMGLGLGSTAGTDPIVSGASSFGIFMGDQDSVDLADANTFSIMGASGGVGIGTVAPTSLFEVEGAAHGDLIRMDAPNLGTSYMAFDVSGNATNVSARIGVEDHVGTHGAHIVFETKNGAGASTTTSEVMRIENGGQVGIGTVAPDSELHVVGDIRFTGVLIDISDKRLKTDIHPLNDKGALLDRIKNVDTYSFRMKDDEKGQIEYGVMAQELEDVFPELVQTANDEMGTKSVNYLGLIAPMIEATKELAAENEALRSQIAQQDDKMAALEAKMDARFAALESDMNSIKIYTGYDPQKAALGLVLLLAMLGSLGFIVYIRRKGGQA